MSIREDESQNRFSALVSGTAAEHMKPALHLRRQNQGFSTVPARPMSPAVLIRNPRGRHHELVPLATTGSRPPGLLQNVKTREAERLYGAEPSQHTVDTPIEIRVGINTERHHDQYRAHIFKDNTAGSSRIPRVPPVDSANPAACLRGSLPQLKSRKSLKQRFDPSHDGGAPSSGRLLVS